jgi:hypothetical protein
MSLIGTKLPIQNVRFYVGSWGLSRLVRDIANATLVTLTGPRRLLGFDVSGPDHLAPLLGFCGIEFRVLVL